MFVVDVKRVSLSLYEMERESEWSGVALSQNESALNFVAVLRPLSTAIGGIDSFKVSKIY